ncbi:oligosaccharide flippase family protein [Neisseria weaveri]|uniref:Lipopolysaccharide biosynthesis translocase n=1 Tax=Neisseria weaveri TaxID=28091 RepID=A0A3S5C4E0_9NEIS|nr:oligosaccharide flippase family protein [Neisseria weaveri]EGV37380.1 polysaccharide biosynthesis family protein [Neisseria weaveri LMG 5135]VEJ51632.1 Lipopolysaccharide biosynthesis translocase [Neisseria weaveri]
MNIRKILGYALGPIGSAAIGLVSLPLISWYFPAEDIGRIVLLQTISGILMVLFNLGLDQAYIREYYSADNKAALFKVVAAPPVVMILLFAAAIIFINPSWPSEKIFELDNAALGILSILFLVSLLLTRHISLILRMQEKAVSFSLSQLTPKLAILLLVCLLIFSGHPTDSLALIGTYAVAQMAAVVILTIQTRKDLIAAAQAPFDPQLVKATMGYGLPMVIGELAFLAFASADRLLLKHLGTLSELGVYSMAVSFGAIALIFQSVFSTIWSPLVFKWVKDNENLHKIGETSLMMTALMIVILSAVGLSSPIITFFLPEQYAPVQFILLSSILFPLLYTLTEVSGIGINVVKKTWLITVISLIALACQFTLLYLLVPTWGARGAAISTAVSFWVLFILKTEISALIWQKLPRKKLYLSTAACVATCVAYTSIGNTQNYFLFALLWLTAIAVVLMLYKNNILSFVQSIKGRLKKS